STMCCSTLVGPVQLKRSRLCYLGTSPSVSCKRADSLAFTLIGYLADGRLNISNALAENAIRPFAVGRRNWLFADTPRGAKASATTYSLIETAKANGVEPFAYLHHVLQHIGNARTVEDIEALLPWNTPVKKMQ
ncbi:transposase domain-containing protein, partial [Thiolapillus sp.]|uniref:transposase domain-containing protein n=1 Tax=Thiolapillus sp. TaxID=2017437 RepID=UPI0025E39998